ncbi:hypothetical protein [Bosea vaviloviae]|uniref:Uncharacterized protein n=1 Tax=Bosea vaviloviae TaxID=1526658 RepID=A0A1D7U313_9HYPH|nr:hypothetical protein [Bosea vaviloviae]AOO81732.1 hypothetical protein BHK69_15875 [Bosea vaviloviae]
MRALLKAHPWIVSFLAVWAGIMSANLMRPYPRLFWTIVAIEAGAVLAYFVWLFWPPPRVGKSPEARPRPLFEDERPERRITTPAKHGKGQE